MKTLMLTEKVKGAPPHLLDSSTFPLSQVENDNLNSSMFYVSLNFKYIQFIYILVHYTNADGDSMPVDCSNTAKHYVYANRLFTEAFHQFTELCLLRNHLERPSAAQMLTHSFFKHCRRHHNITELLHPVIPMSDRIATNPGKSLPFKFNS